MRLAVVVGVALLVTTPQVAGEPVRFGPTARYITEEDFPGDMQCTGTLGPTIGRLWLDHRTADDGVVNTLECSDRDKRFRCSADNTTIDIANYNGSPCTGEPEWTSVGSGECVAYTTGRSRRLTCGVTYPLVEESFTWGDCGAEQFYGRKPVPSGCVSSVETLINCPGNEFSVEFFSSQTCDAGTSYFGFAQTAPLDTCAGNKKSYWSPACRGIQATSPVASTTTTTTTTATTTTTTLPATTTTPPTTPERARVVAKVKSASTRNAIAGATIECLADERRARARTSKATNARGKTTLRRVASRGADGVVVTCTASAPGFRARSQSFVVMVDAGEKQKYRLAFRLRDAAA